MYLQIVSSYLTIANNHVIPYRLVFEKQLVAQEFPTTYACNFYPCKLEKKLNICKQISTK